jgi:hypothetical protein
MDTKIAKSTHDDRRETDGFPADQIKDFQRQGRGPKETGAIVGSIEKQ